MTGTQDHIKGAVVSDGGIMICDILDMDGNDETNSRGGLVTMSFWKGKTAAILCAAAVFVTIFMTGTADVFAAVDDHTVQGKTPQGTVISLFDYWVNEQSSPDHGGSNNNSNGGINKNHDLKFSDGTESGINGWTGSAAPKTGMLQNTLDSSGYPVLASNFWSGIFYASPLAYLFDDTEVEGKKA